MGRRVAGEELHHKEAQVKIHEKELSVEQAKEHSEDLIAVVDNKTKLSRVRQACSDNFDVSVKGICATPFCHHGPNLSP
jgi:hypothetical protein